MSDRAIRLEDLSRLIGCSIEALERSSSLSLDSKRLTSVPLGVCDLTGLVDLALKGNLLSSLPPEISRLTGLVMLNVSQNQLSSLPPEILYLTGLIGLSARDNHLSSLPPEISALTGLADLSVRDNHLSSLPPEISTLTGLTLLALWSNLIVELPAQITALTNLKNLWIQDGSGKISIKRAPRGISNLPCWSDTSKWSGQITNGEALHRLQFFDPVDTVLETRKAEEARKVQETSNAEEIRKVEEIKKAEIKQSLLHEKEMQFVKAKKTVHPDETKVDYKPFAEGEIFKVQSTTAPSGSLKVINQDDDFYIEEKHVEKLGKGCCGHKSPKDQEKRREKLDKADKSFRQSHSSPEPKTSTAKITKNEREVNVSEAEINACLAGGLCAVCFSQYRNPCLLPCAHVFCAECIKASIVALKEEPPFRCPLCHAPAYVDQKTVGELKPFHYDHTSLGDMNANLEKSAENAAVEVLKCKGRRCTKDATHYCENCGEKGIYCEAHSEMHLEVSEDHIIKELASGALPSTQKSEKCVVHESEIKFFCPSCLESPLKCVECVFEDKAHLDEHKKLDQDGADIKLIIAGKMEQLWAFEAKLGPNLGAVENKIKEVLKQSEDKTNELDKFIKELEDKVKWFKEQAKNELDSLNQFIIAPLEESQKKLHCEMRRIHIAKLTLSKISEKKDNERSLIQTGNALRFANQVLYSKHDTSIRIAPLNIVSKIPKSIIDNLEKLNDSFMFGLSDSYSAEQQEPEANQNKVESLYSITTVPSSIPAAPRATFDTSSSRRKIEFPWGICVHPKNENLYVTDEDMQTVRVFDKNLKLLSSHYTGLIIPKTIHGPRGIVISNNGLIATADCEGHTVKLFTDNFTFIKPLGDQKGSGEGQFNRPYSVAFDSKGNLYVADSGNMRVQKFNNKGEFISVIGNQTEKSSLFTSLVNGVCVNEEDKLLVLCAGSDHLRVFSKDGAFEKNVKLEVPTSIEGWSHIFRASRGVFGVCENKTGAVTFYDYEGKVQHRIFLDGCIGACFGLDGTFYVTSLSNKSISAFSAAE